MKKTNKRENNGSLGSQRLPLRYITENNYTLRSAKSSNSHNGYTINHGIGGIFLSKLFEKVFLGSRAALITTDYSSSNTSSTNGGSGSGTTPAKPSIYDDSNYATLYDYVASSGCGESANSSVDKYSNSLQTVELDEEVEQRVYDEALSLNKYIFSDTKTAATVVAAQVDSDCSKIEVRF